MIASCNRGFIIGEKESWQVVDCPAPRWSLKERVSVFTDHCKALPINMLFRGYTLVAFFKPFATLCSFFISPKASGKFLRAIGSLSFNRAK